MNTWSTVRVADIAARGSNSMATGPFGSSISSKYFRTSGVPVIRGGNLSSDSSIRLIDKNLVFLDRAKAAEFSRSTVREGDLVFTSWGTINQVGLIDQGAAYSEYIISNKQMKITPDPETTSAVFLYYLFSTPSMQREILEGSIGSSIPGFNLTRLKSLELELPPLEEQVRIATVVVDAERVESTLRQLIKKKRSMRLGIMQRLLMGQTRLSGSRSPWHMQLSVADIATRFSGYWGEVPGTLEVDIDIVRAGDVSAANRIDGTVRRSLTRAQMERSSCRPGDVILTTSGTIGNVALVTTNTLAASNFVRVLRPKNNIIGEYLFYALQSARARSVMESHMGISAMPNLGAGFFRDRFLNLPTVSEQEAIVEVLRDIDAEITALHARLRKARAVKTGIMQELFTGRTRLPLTGVAA